MTGSQAEFRPDYCMAPAATLREWMQENGFTAALIATAASGRAGREAALALVSEVLDRGPLTGEHAAVLARGTFIPERVWLALEHSYRAGLAAGLKDVTEDRA